MKLIITSIDAIIDKESGEYFPGIKEAFESFKEAREDNTVAVISIHQEELDKIPDDFIKLHIGNYRLRQSPELIEIITEKTDLDYNDIFVLGAKESDLILAANAKVLLLTADYARKNNPEDRIYTDAYGIGILQPGRLIHFFDHYLKIEKPWFFSAEVDDSTQIYGLTDAMTMKQNDDTVVDICSKLKDFLKNSNPKYKNPFLIYTLMSIYQIFKDVENINYWGYYPSSGTEPNDTLFDFKEVLRKSFKSSRTKENVFLRTKSSTQRKFLSSTQRLGDGCDSQFDSIIINPWFRNKLRGKNVCILDDFTTYGSSCETTRHLLQKAGVAKIIFITLGKFRYNYTKFDYTLDGDIFQENGYTYIRNGTHTTINGTVNNNSSNELLESLKELVK